MLVTFIQYLCCWCMFVCATWTVLTLYNRCRYIKFLVYSNVYLKKKRDIKDCVRARNFIYRWAVELSHIYIKAASTFSSAVYDVVVALLPAAVYWYNNKIPLHISFSICLNSYNFSAIIVEPFCYLYKYNRLWFGLDASRFPQWKYNLFYMITAAADAVCIAVAVALLHHHTYTRVSFCHNALYTLKTRTEKNLYPNTEHQIHPNINMRIIWRGYTFSGAYIFRWVHTQHTHIEYYTSRHIRQHTFDGTCTEYNVCVRFVCTLLCVPSLFGEYSFRKFRQIDCEKLFFFKYICIWLYFEGFFF